MGTTAGPSSAGATPAVATSAGSRRTRQDELRELSRQARLRVGEADRLRAEHRLITAQSDRRLEESRLLLDRARDRGVLPTSRQV